TTSGVIGVPALAAAMFVAPAAAMTLAVGMIVLALVFASPAGFLMLALATSADSVQETTAYFALLGLLGLSIGIAAVVAAILAAGARVRNAIARIALLAIVAAAIYLAWPTAAQALSGSTLTFTRTNPRTAVLAAAGVLLVVVAYAAARRNAAWAL